MRTYFLQRRLNDNGLCRTGEHWEEVDLFTFQNMDKAVCDETGQERYNGNWISVDNGVVEGSFSNLSVNHIGRILRFCGGNERDATNAVPGGWARKPVSIKFKPKKGNKTTLRCMLTGKSYVEKTEKKDEPSVS